MSDLQHPVITDETIIEAADGRVAEAFVPLSETIWIRALGKIVDLTDQEPMYFASAGVIGTAMVLRDRDTLRAGTRLLAAHLFATALRGVAKKLIDRTRPKAAAERGEYEAGAGERYESDFNSFPSGHAAGAFAAARALGRDYPQGRGTWLGVAGLAATAQVVRSKHYPTDVVAGAALGILAEAAVDQLISRAERI